MAGHSRLKDGVASARLRPAVHVFLGCGTKVVDARDKPGHDDFSNSLSRYSSTNVTVSATLAREVR
jgi:hypothetical protein